MEICKSVKLQTCLTSKRFALNASGSPKLYFVKMDIKAAFDSLNQKGLLLVISEILRQVSPGISRKVNQNTNTSDYGRMRITPLRSMYRCCRYQEELLCYSESKHILNVSLSGLALCDVACSHCVDALLIST